GEGEERDRLEGYREGVVRGAGGHPGQDEEVEGDEEQGDDEEPAAGGLELPVVQGVLPGAEKGGGDAGEEQEGEEGPCFEAVPEGDDQGDGAADDQQPADQLAPEDVTLLHEGPQDVGQGAAGPRRRGRLR